MLRHVPVVTANGFRWCVGEGDDSFLPTVEWHENGIEKIIDAHLPEGGVALDIGAHVGKFTLHFARRASHVIALEPGANQLRYLLANLQVNGIVHVSVMPIAAWHKEELLGAQHTTVPQGDAMGMMRVQADPKATEPIPGARMDIVLPPLERLDFVKIDVEGAELSALLGMRRIILQHRPVIMLEVHEWAKQETQLQRLLQMLNYSIAIVPGLDETIWLCKPEVSK